MHPSPNRLSVIKLYCFLFLYNPVHVHKLYVKDFEVLPASPGETLILAEDLDPKQKRLHQLKKRLEIELKVKTLILTENHSFYQPGIVFKRLKLACLGEARCREHD